MYRFFPVQARRDDAPNWRSDGSPFLEFLASYTSRSRRRSTAVAARVHDRAAGLCPVGLRRQTSREVTLSGAAGALTAKAPALGGDQPQHAPPHHALRHRPDVSALIMAASRSPARARLRPALRTKARRVTGKMLATSASVASPLGRRIFGHDGPAGSSPPWPDTVVEQPAKVPRRARPAYPGSASAGFDGVPLHLALDGSCGGGMRRAVGGRRRAAGRDPSGGWSCWSPQPSRPVELPRRAAQRPICRSRLGRAVVDANGWDSWRARSRAATLLRGRKVADATEFSDDERELRDVYPRGA